MFDPLEQFSIEIFSSYLNLFSFFFYPLLGYFQQSFPAFGILLIFPTTTVSKVVTFNFFFIFFIILTTSSSFFFNKIQKSLDFLYFFILSIVKDSISLKKYSFILILFTTFLFLFFSNLVGMFPYSATVTSHLILTLYFSLSFFIGSNLIGLCFHKQTFFVLFLPEGVPLMIVPFLILIEYISYLSRIFSLAIRLFANMLSGHILLKILISFIWILTSSHCIFWFWNILPMAIVFGVIGLEFAIAFLQAYVFVVLLTIYLKDLIHTH